MKRHNYLQLAVAVTMLLSTTVTSEDLSSTEPTTDETPLQPGKTPNCINLNLNYEDFFKVAEEEGDVLLNGEDSSDESANKEDETEEANTTDTTMTTPQTEPCVLPEVSDGTQYNWWQILLETGGEPGTLNGTEGPNAKNPPSAQSAPCSRPLQSDDEDAYIYNNKSSDFKTYYRDETSFPRFHGTPKYFEDIRGELVWTPPQRANDTRVYQIDYVYDDTGFWVSVVNSNCEFEADAKSLICSPIPTCECREGDVEPHCTLSAPLPANLLATLIGG